MSGHVCEWAYDESDLNREVTCVHGCGTRMRVVHDGEGGIALQRVS